MFLNFFYIISKVSQIMLKTKTGWIKIKICRTISNEIEQNWTHKHSWYFIPNECTKLCCHGDTYLPGL